MASNIADIIPFLSFINPKNIVKKAISDKFVHTTENMVKYFERVIVDE